MKNNFLAKIQKQNRTCILLLIYNQLSLSSWENVRLRDKHVSIIII